jgi:hypothetical protein
MGTPHRGSSFAYWAKLVANVLATTQLGVNTSPRLLKDLQRNSTVLSSISQQTVELLSALRIRTFYELEKLNFIGSLVQYLFIRRISWLIHSGDCGERLCCPTCRERGSNSYASKSQDNMPISLNGKSKISARMESN